MAEAAAPTTTYHLVVVKTETLTGTPPTHTAKKIELKADIRGLDQVLRTNSDSEPTNAKRNEFMTELAKMVDPGASIGPPPAAPAPAGTPAGTPEAE